MRVSMFGLVVLLGGCMTSNMRKTLTRPADFQRLYGDHVRIVTLQTLPADPWVGLTIKGWTFDHVTFKGTTFKNVTFENVQFQDVTFDSDPENGTIIRNCVFRNCTFRNVTFLDAQVIENTFSGGGIHGLETGESRVDYQDGVWKSNTFENMTLEDMYITHQGGDWEASTFRNVIFRNNNIHYGFITGEFHQSTLEGNRSGGGVNRGINALFQQCTFGENKTVEDGIVGAFVAPKFLQSYDNNFNMSGNFYDVDLPIRNDWVSVGTARNVRVIGPNKSFWGRGEDIEFHNIHSGGVDLEDGIRIKGYDINVENFSFGYGPFIDCVFKNVTTEYLGLVGNPKFIRCTFENFRITESIRMKAPYPVFQDCRFINVRRDPNVRVFEREVTIDYTFPWESSPGVSKPDTP